MGLLRVAFALLVASRLTRSTEITIMPALDGALAADEMLTLLAADERAAPLLGNESGDAAVARAPAAAVDDATFRNYDDAANPRGDMVRNHYRMMRAHQSYAFVERMMEKYSFADGRARATMTVRDGFRALDGYVDSSDPDMSLPNVVHNFQTAEGIRKAGHPDWMQLVGLIHDMGKMMFLWGDAADGQRGTAESPQWALGGDTWVVGMPPPASAVYPEFNALNADAYDARYNSSLGVYARGVGLDNVRFAYGHDEYMYRMLLANDIRIPKAGLAMIRYHSCYPWHTGGAYRELMAPEDHETLRAVLEFNAFDLYTKDEDGAREVDMDALWPYYQTLIDKYMPGELRW